MLDEHQITAVTGPLESAWTLPPVAYTSADVFAVEARNIFYREWICVARQEQLANVGDYRAVDVLDQPLIIVRAADQSIQAMSAICPHRGMPVVQGVGNASSFSCPYHLWKFGLDGALISAPLMQGAENFCTEDYGLTRVRVETWQGFVFVNLDETAPSLLERLPNLDAVVAGYDMADMVIAGSVEFDSPWNWKILVENFMESYHHIGPHRESLQSTYPARNSYVSGSVQDGWSVLHMPSVQAEEEGLPALPNLTELQKSEILASVIMPTFCWINTPSVAFWYQLNPSSFEQMQLTIHALLPRGIAESEMGEGVGQAVVDGVQHIHLEDIAVNEGPWQGMHAPLTRQGRLSPLEKAIWQLNNWWVSRVCDRV